MFTIQPGGSLFITTVNRTIMANVLAIFAAEKILRIVPDGAHDWNKFVKPEELEKLLEKSKLLIISSYPKGLFM